MEYKLGNSKNIKSQGETTELTCPKCGELVNFSVFTNLNTQLAAQFPPVKVNNVYFAVCPNCSALYGIDEAQGKEFKKGEKLAVGNYDLKELKQFVV